MVFTSYISISCAPLNYTNDIFVEDNFLLGALMMKEGYKWDRNGPTFINRKTIDKFINKEITMRRSIHINKRFEPKFHYLATQFEQTKKNDFDIMVKEYVTIMDMIVSLRNDALHPGYVKLSYHHRF